MKKDHHLVSVVAVAREAFVTYSRQHVDFVKQVCRTSALFFSD